MNLYRLDAEVAPGRFVPLTDFLGVKLYRSRAKANEDARYNAADQDHFVRITRITGAGSLKVLGTFAPSGAFCRQSS